MGRMGKDHAGAGKRERSQGAAETLGRRQAASKMAAVIVGADRPPNGSAVCARGEESGQHPEVAAAKRDEAALGGPHRWQVAQASAAHCRHPSCELTTGQPGTGDVEGAWAGGILGGLGACGLRTASDTQEWSPRPPTHFPTRAQSLREDPGPHKEGPCPHTDEYLGQYVLS